MMGEEKHQTREVFTATLALNTPEARARYLDEACRDKPELRQRVEALLGAHDQAGGFLQPTVRAPPADDYLLEHAGVRIGRYKLLQEIGEGGFGQVFMAEQKEPVQRKVALKIIKAGMDTKEVIARFEAERQALALMDHPNIARVFDGGVTRTGRPYFVMELVRGIPITEYCDRNNLPMTGRLELFMQVCQAVQHAHQKAIIHRDLKPTNILVTIIDAKPVPKIIDFGVAKALGQKLTEKTLFTAFEQIIGTPAYMSPEQAELSGMDVDTRSDIYALGVLLYELLTGVTPFDAETLRNAALDEVRRMIRETEPPKPSTRLRTLGDKLSEVAQHRHSEPSELPRLVHGDLDCIVMKALEKDRARRYETAGALAEDLQRHLDHHPVQASPPGTLYRARKFVWRHRVGVTLSATVVAALMVGLSVAILGFVKAQRERDHALAAEAQAEKNRRQAEAQREKAQTEATRSAQVAQFMKDMLEGVGPGVALGRDTTILREILDQTAQRLDDLKAQPEVEADLRETLGKVYRDLGEYDHAEAMLLQSLKLRQNLHQLESGEHADVANAIHDLAVLYSLRWENPKAEENFRKALAMRQRLFGHEHPDVAASLYGLANVLRRNSDTYAEAEAAFREALAIQRRQLGDAHPDVAGTLASLGILLRNMPGRLGEAEACLREALQLQRRSLGNENPRVAGTLCNLGYTISKTPARRSEAESLIREALEIQRKVLGDHPQTATSLHFLARVVTNQSEVIQLRREVLAMRRKILRPDHPEISSACRQLVDLLHQAGKLEEAQDVLRQQITFTREVDDNKAVAGLLTELAAIRLELGEEVTLEELFPSTGPPPSDKDANALRGIAQRLRKNKKGGAIAAGRLEVQLQKELHGEESTEVARAMVSLARILSEQGRPDEAEPLARKAVEIQKLCHGQYDPTVSHALREVGFALSSQGRSRFAEAEEAYREVLAVEVELKGMGRPQSDFAIFGGRELGDLLEQQGRYPQAEAVYREVLVIHQKRDHQFANLLVSLATVLEKQGRLAEAEAALRQAVAILRRSVEKHPSQSTLRISLGRTLWNLCGELETRGRLTEARDVYEEALHVFEKASKDFPTQPFLRQEEAHTSWLLATLLNRSGQLDEAAEQFKRALSLYFEALTDFPDRSVFRERLVAVRLDLAHLLKTQNKGKEASNCIRETSDLISSWPADATKAVCLGSLSLSLASEGRLSEAETVACDALAICRKIGNEDRNLDRSLGILARVLGDQGKWAEAEEVRREELALEKRLSGEKHPFVANSLSSLASVLAAQGKLAEARTNLLESLEMSSGNNPALYYCALVHLGTGDTNGYRSMTMRIAVQLSTNAPGQNTHLLRWACALAPEAVPDYSPVLQSTRQALASATNTVNSYSDQQTLGALLYRAQQYDKAVDELTRTVELGERLDAKTLLTSPVYGAYFLTMAHARLGHTVKARECFQRASALDPLTTPNNTNAVSRIYWNRRLTLGLLRKEAESLLKPDTPDSDTD